MINSSSLDSGPRGLWLKRCLHEYTNLFYRQTLFLQPGVRLGRVGTGSVSPIMHISLSARGRPRRPPQPIRASASEHWPIRAGRRENPSMKISLSARARRGRCTEPVPCPSSGGVTQIKGKSYNDAFRKWIDTQGSSCSCKFGPKTARKSLMRLFGDPLHPSQWRSIVSGLLSGSLLEASDKILMHRLQTNKHDQIVKR